MKKNLMNKKQGFFALFVTIMSFVFVVSVIIIPTIKADAPSITIPENNGYYRVLTNITGTTTGTCVNVSIYNVTGTYFNGSAWTATFINLSCNVTGTDWYYGNLSAFPTWTNGTTYEITANSSDGATNATASFIYDTWAPIATITSPSTSSWQNGSLANITGTATDGDGSSGVWMVNITLFNASLGTYWTGSAWGSTATNLTATGTTSWYKNSGWPTWTNGTTYVVNASAVDNASNNGSTTSSVTFYMDTGGLVSQVTPISGYWKTTTPLTITATANDSIGGSGLKNVTLYYYNSSTDNSTWLGPWNFGTNSSPWFGVSWSFNFSNGTGYYQFFSIAIDNASNTETAPITNDSMCGYDFTAPATSVDVISPYCNNAAITITGAVSDNNISGISSVLLYCLNSTDNSTWSSAWLVGTDSDPWVAISWSFDFAAKNGTGYYRFFTIGVDNATNV
ncbi:MAG: hypothetical protein NT038_08395, partial [Euryarchaeota archaeon]|nr:hypothetical protein [Euryarchaeota archaeon]